MRLRVTTYPTEWKRCFAFGPIQVSATEMVWWETYEYRWLSYHEVENRALGSNESFRFVYGDDYY